MKNKAEGMSPGQEAVAELQAQMKAEQQESEAKQAEAKKIEDEGVDARLDEFMAEAAADETTVEQVLEKTDEEASEIAAKEGVEIDTEEIQQQEQELKAESKSIFSKFKDKMKGMKESLKSLFSSKETPASETVPTTQTEGPVFEFQKNVGENQAERDFFKEKTKESFVSTDEKVNKIVDQMNTQEISATIENFSAENLAVAKTLAKEGLSDKEIVTTFLNARENNQDFDAYVKEKAPELSMGETAAAAAEDKETAPAETAVELPDNAEALQNMKNELAKEYNRLFELSMAEAQDPSKWAEGEKKVYKKALKTGSSAEIDALPDSPTVSAMKKIEKQLSDIKIKLDGMKKAEPQSEQAPIISEKTETSVDTTTGGITIRKGDKTYSISKNDSGQIMFYYEDSKKMSSIPVENATDQQMQIFSDSVMASLGDMKKANIPDMVIDRIAVLRGKKAEKASPEEIKKENPHDVLGYKGTVSDLEKRKLADEMDEILEEANEEIDNEAREKMTPEEKKKEKEAMDQFTPFDNKLIKAKRTDGTIDDGWRVIGKDDESGRITIFKYDENRKERLTKAVKAEELLDVQKLNITPPIELKKAA